MKIVKLIAVAAGLALAPVLGLGEDKPAPAEKPACCAKAAEAGEACKNQCCVDAANEGKACEKCKPSKKEG